MQPMTLLQADRIAYSFGNLPVFADVSLTLVEGAFVALVGPSGIGKSTLLRLLMGTLQPTAGQVTMHGIAPHETAEPIGVVFQRDNLMPWRTAYENVRLPLELKGENGRFAQERVMSMLELVGLSGYEDHYPAQLSGGMAQRVAIARALVHQPALLLLDEPFGALDALTRERMGQELLRIWQAMPVTVFMVTHSIGEAVLLADEVLVMGSNDAGQSTPATLTHRVPIALPRPRQLEMQFGDSFRDYVLRIREALT
jgi:NitT/TauT family transport system ATP-binding protein